MSAELAHQKADKHLCVALHRKLRIRLHPSKGPDCRIGQDSHQIERQGITSRGQVE